MLGTGCDGMRKEFGRGSGKGNIRDDLLERFSRLNVWKEKGKRAPNKPLLAIWAIGRCLTGKPRLVSYEVVEKEVGILLRRFGPYRRRIRTDYPFWHLQNDGVWEIDRPGVVRSTSKGDAYIGDLRRHSIRGGFTSEVFRCFRKDSELAHFVAESLVAEHFPRTLHYAILDAALVPTEVAPDTGSAIRVEFERVRRRRRDRGFRRRILRAYAARCAVCAFAARLDNEPIALEAAHIRWHEADGPSLVRNGLALCALHHSLFDAGAFTVLPKLEIVVARSVDGVGVYEALRRFDRQPLRVAPKESRLVPSGLFLKWHTREVFKEPRLIA